ncbi:MAG: hypothetical protein JXR70_11645 [Spirochaetales bacterium]|nr:hypothetical protein [Spirochaetales bacterium]
MKKHSLALPIPNALASGKSISLISKIDITIINLQWTQNGKALTKLQNDTLVMLEAKVSGATPVPAVIFEVLI